MQALVVILDLVTINPEKRALEVRLGCYNCGYIVVVLSCKQGIERAMLLGDMTIE